MNIYVSPTEGLPLYLQIVNQIKYLLAARRLKPGQELPPIRALAEKLLINPNTVARAYRELEAAGLLISRRGAGTHVSDEGSPLARKERLKILNDRIDALLAEAAQLDVDHGQLTDMIEKRRRAMHGET
jgi:GntR family transcriptional regulator